MSEILLSGTLNLNSNNRSIQMKLQQSKSTVFSGNFLLSLTTFGTNIGSYDIFYMVIYVTLTNLTEHWNCLYSAVT